MRRALAWAVIAVACADEDPGVRHAEISGGTSDSTDVAVVGIYDSSSGATCTGSLIAPNLVLTAQHCVAQLVGAFDCQTVDFGPPGAPGNYYVTTKATFTFTPTDYHSVSEVRVPPGSGVCGRDVALVVLADLVDPTEAEDLVPRVDAPPVVGETYAAVGYGATDDVGSGSGERRRRDGLTIARVGDDGSGSVADEEWVGEAGVCQGDSGGPALDAEGQVIGVASRGSFGCIDPVYAHLEAHGSWLKDEAQRAATSGGYEPPAWAVGVVEVPDAGVPVPDATPDAMPPAGSDGGGCRAAPGGTSGGLVALLLCVGLAVLRARPRA